MPLLPSSHRPVFTKVSLFTPELSLTPLHLVPLTSGRTVVAVPEILGHLVPIVTNLLLFNSDSVAVVLHVPPGLGHRWGH